jgi:hypothetical protein
MCSEYLPMGAMIAPYGCFDVSSVLLTSNDEVVALSVCTILMAGSVRTEICSCSDRTGRTDYDLPAYSD